MKKLVISFVAAVILVILLFVTAFLYIDMSGHRNFAYEVFVGGRLYGSVKVDRYVTENKIVFKSSSIFPYSMGYPTTSEKLFLNKRTKMPIKFTSESVGTRGRKRIIMLDQNDELTDFLYLEHPRYITLKEFETGEKTMIFSPRDVLSYMPLMEKYNYWKKGAQFFEVMIPPESPIPPLREKIEVRYLRDEYIPVMGRRIEGESYKISARGIPEATVVVSKYGHRVLALDVGQGKMRFDLIGYIEGPGKRLRPFMEKFSEWVDLLKKGGSLFGGKHSDAERRAAERTDVHKSPDRKINGSREVFFESDNLILSGKIWYPPAEEGPFPAVLLIPEDGPVTTGERSMLKAIARNLSTYGIIAMVYDGPGQGKSQGSFSSMDDGKRIAIIKDAVRFLSQQPGANAASVSLVGYSEGGFIAIKTAYLDENIHSCILLGLPTGFEKEILSETDLSKTVQKLLEEQGIGPLDDQFMQTIADMVREHLLSILQSGENVTYFMGMEMPVREYRQLIERKPYELMLSYDKPLFLVVGRDDKYFDPRLIARLKVALKQKNKLNKVAEFRYPGRYMGAMAAKDDSWEFLINPDVLRTISKWIHDSSAPVPAEPTKSAPQP
ncbi:MAG: hypothetical protein GF409_01790 [Candidatus Omnitrophica bacterium]|nr:hypothetical protein [Candidatus Omnitrophota bacterium]